MTKRSCSGLWRWQLHFGRYCGRMRCEQVVSVTDCRPAAIAVSSMYSKSSQMRFMARGLRTIAARWLGVHIPREANMDADRLSHPSRFSEEVARKATEWGLAVVRLDVPGWCWAVLEEAIARPLASEDAEWMGHGYVQARALSAHRRQLVGRRAEMLARTGEEVSVSDMLLIEAGSASGAHVVGMGPPQPRQPSERLLASKLGITGALSPQDRDVWSVQPSFGERATLTALRDGADGRMLVAHGSESGSASHLGTALRWLRRFVGALLSRQLFVCGASIRGGRRTCSGLQ
ncbi:MAG: hypothetical protein SGPRY_004464 [Prymnesium sp.]